MKKNLLEFQSLTPNGTEILGIIFDHYLNWKLNIESRINACRNAFGKSWGLSPKSLLWLYSAVVRPIVCYNFK